MKKIIILILAFVFVISSLSSCGILDEPNQSGGGGGNQSGENSTENDQTDNTVEGAIYYSGSSLGFVVDNALVRYTSTLYNALSQKVNLVTAKPSSSPMGNEVVIGKAVRDVSDNAYQALEILKSNDNVNEGSEDSVYWLIYTDGSSLAIAYDEHPDLLTLEAAIDWFVNNLITDTLILEPGTVGSGSINLLEYYKAQDAARIEEKWAKLETLIDNGTEIVAAFKDLYSLYSDSIIDWFAGLYEHNICQCSGATCQGGKTCGTAAFYYSNSARDNDGYLPDIESTIQALGFLETSGMTENYTKSLPADMLDRIGRYVLSLQAEDGYFYHPIWGTNVYLSRKSRDLMWAESLLKDLGLQPIYDTPNGMKGSGVASRSALATYMVSRSTELAASNVLRASAVDPNLKDEASFRKYLNSLNIKKNSYSAGNTLASYFNTIRSRNYELKREGADYDLIEILFEHLNDTQNKETGTWYYVSKSDPSYSEYYAINGVMKISTIYSSAGVLMPNADKALRAAADAIISTEEVTACVDIYNTWFAIDNIFSMLKKCGGTEGYNLMTQCRSELRSRASEMILATKAKVEIFQKPDGSFSYTPKYSSDTSQGAAAAVPYTVEGDVNATVICSNRIVNLIFTCIGVDPVPIFTNADMYRFNKLIDQKISGDDEFF